MISRLIFMVLASIIMNKAFSETCDAYFPNVVQGHATGSTISFSEQAYLITPESKLNFTNPKGAIPGRCSASEWGTKKPCQITGDNVPSIQLPNFQTTDKGDDLTYGSDDDYYPIVDISVSDIQTLITQAGAKVTFIASNTSFKINKATFTANSRVTLQSGTYWFNELTISGDSKVYIEGPVTIYVNGDLIMQDQGELNYGDNKAKDLTIFNWSNVSMIDNAKASAVLYSTAMNMEKVTRFKGAISVQKTLTLSDDSKVYGEDISGALCPTPVDKVELIAGRVTLNDTRTKPEFTYVCFDEPFSVVPAIFSLPTTANSDDRLTLRIRNVTESGFEIAQVESRENAKPGTPSGNVSQTVDFLAVVPGDYNLDGGAKMRVGSVATKKFRSRAFGQDWEVVSTADLGFSSPPSIIASIQTMQNEPQAGNLTGPFPISQPFLATAVSNVNNTSFRLALERAETLTGTVDNNESIAYLAITQGLTGQLSDDITYESFVTPQNIRGINSCHNFNFLGPNTTGNPLVIASQNTRNGGDGGWLRRCAIASTNVGFSIVEDSDRDTDNNHINEIAAGLVLRGNFKDFTNTCSPVDTIDHYQISHTGSALTCSPAIINVKACSDTSCSEVASGDVEVTLSAISASPTDSIWSQNPVTIPGGSTAGIDVNLTHTQEEIVTIGVDTAALNPAVCSPNCDLPFYDSGFVFDIPTQTSCETSTDITISAVRKDLTTQQCIPGFSNVNKTLKFWTNYVSPTTGTKPVTLIQNAISHVLTSTEGTAVNIAFDANGEAVFNVNYDDAGQLSLNASHDGTGNQTGLRMLGSDIFVNVPEKLIVESSDSNADCASGNPNDTSCTVFKAAGEKFNFSVSATCSDNTVTPNFEMANIPLTVNTIAPASGAPADLGIDKISFIDADNGQHTENEQTISEVGVFTITATPTANGYFNETVPAATSTSIGRFIPDHFILSDPNDGSLGGGNPFVYTGQMVSAAATETVGQITYADAPSFTITAKAVSGSTTLNYTGSFIKLQAIDAHIERILPVRDTAQLGADATNKVDLIAKLNNASLAGSNGALQYQFNFTDNYVYTRNSNAIIAPFDAAIALQINTIKDADGATAKDFDGTAKDGIITLDPIGLEIRFGRWVLENSYGPETTDLRVPMQLQYWDGSFYALNKSDSFTGFNATNASITANSLLPTSPNPLIYGAGLFISGETNLLTVTSPGMNVRGPVTVEQSAPSWLQFDWNNDGSYENNPSSQVNFGLYRGNDRIIYRQEVFE